MENINPLLGSISGMGVGDMQGTIINMMLSELRKQFGNATLENRGTGKVIVVRLDKNTIKNYVFKGLDPALASSTDIDIKNGAIELIIRVI